MAAKRSKKKKVRAVASRTYGTIYERQDNKRGMGLARDVKAGQAYGMRLYGTRSWRSHGGVGSERA